MMILRVENFVSSLIVYCFAILLPGCMSVPSVDDSGKDTIEQRLMGGWVSKGKHWMFKQDGEGVLDVYEGHDFFLEGKFHWELTGKILDIEYSADAPWPWTGKLGKYEIKQVTEKELNLMSSEGPLFLERDTQE